MHKKIVVALVVTLLFLEGAVTLLADEPATPTEDTEFHEAIESPTGDDETLCGDGNGGGGTPG